jgi:hypothetical protein
MKEIKEEIRRKKKEQTTKTCALFNRKLFGTFRFGFSALS